MFIHAVSLMTDVPPVVGAVIGFAVLAAADVAVWRWWKHRKG